MGDGDATVEPEGIEEPDDDGRRGIPWARIVGTFGILAMALFWIWIFAGGPSRENEDRLSDRAWVARARTICARAMDDLDGLAAAPATPSPAARAETVEAANRRLAAMVNDLDAREPQGADDAEVVDEWLTDWEAYLEARRNYAADVRDDPGTNLLLPEKFGDPLDTVMRIFANVNGMESCEPPGDVV